MALRDREKFVEISHLDWIISLRSEVEESTLEPKSIIEAGQVAAITKVRGSTSQEAAKTVISKISKF